MWLRGNGSSIKTIARSHGELVPARLCVLSITALIKAQDSHKERIEIITAEQVRLTDKCNISARSFPEKSEMRAEKPQPCPGNREYPGQGWRDSSCIQLCLTPGIAAQVSESLLSFTQSQTSSG